MEHATVPMSLPSVQEHLQGCATPAPHPVGIPTAVDQHFCSPLPCKNSRSLEPSSLTIATGCHWFFLPPIASAQNQLSLPWQTDTFYK